MEQLGLDLTPRMSYTGGQFVIHSGVKEILSGIDLLLDKKNFSPAIVYGRHRTGKTHLSVHLVDTCISKKRFPRLVDQDEFLSVLTLIQGEGLKGEGVVIVDDIDVYLRNVKPGESGPFVHFWEFLRQREIHLVLLTSASINELPCDEHVISRLHSANKFTIGDPEEKDLDRLVHALASQRGIKLGDRKISFLQKRMRRDIPSLEHYFERLVHLSTIFGEKVKFNLLEDAL